MLRSGLALAGVNTWLENKPLPQEAEGGSLIAEDVLGLDLSNTEMVVLSACDTLLLYNWVRHIIKTEEI